MSDKLKVLKAIHDVYKLIGYVQKTGKMEGGKQSYKYASEADFISALRPAMIECGLISHPHNFEVIHKESVEVGQYKTQTVKTMIKATYRISHVESGEYIDVPALSEGLDTADKGLFKAMTGAQKYALRQSFLVETGDDPDDTPSDNLKQSKKPNMSGKISEWPEVKEGIEEYEKMIAEQNVIAHKIMKEMNLVTDLDGLEKCANYNKEKIDGLHEVVKADIRTLYASLKHHFSQGVK